MKIVSELKKEKLEKEKFIEKWIEKDISLSIFSANLSSIIPNNDGKSKEQKVIEGIIDGKS